jgi:TatD DNase family protein
MIVDTHAHVTLCGDFLTPAQYDADCHEGKVAWVLDAGIHPSDFAARKAALSPRHGFSTVFHLGVALAPHEVERGGKAGLDEVERILREENPLAISEIGLEYAHKGEHREAQRELFAAQLALAKRYQKPVFLHIRDAWDDAAPLVAESGVRRGAVHCFSGGVKEARAFLDLGFHLSFSGIVTFKNAITTQEAARYCPIDRLLTETDAPWLAPMPHRGKKNRSSWVRHTNVAVANLRGAQENEVHRAVRRNAEALLGLG